MVSVIKIRGLSPPPKKLNTKRGREERYAVDEKKRNQLLPVCCQGSKVGPGKGGWRGGVSKGRGGGVGGGGAQSTELPFNYPGGHREGGKNLSVSRLRTGERLHGPSKDNQREKGRGKRTKDLVRRMTRSQTIKKRRIVFVEGKRNPEEGERESTTLPLMSRCEVAENQQHTKKGKPPNGGGGRTANNQRGGVK